MRCASALALLGLLLSANACTGTEAAMSRRQGDELRTRLSSDGTERANLADARAHLAFAPVVPESAAGRSLVAIYTRADTLLQVLYDDDILITEKQWDASVVPDEAAYGKGLTDGAARADEYIRSMSFKGHTLWLIDAVSLPESTDASGAFLPGVTIEVSQVCWFTDGVSYIVGCPTLTADELLPVAKAMIE